MCKGYILYSTNPKTHTHTHKYIYSNIFLWLWHTFAQCRDLENQHHEQQLEIALATLEKVVKNELEEEIPDDMAMVSGKQSRSLNVETNKNLCLFIMNNEEEVMVTIYVPDTYFSIDCCFVLVSYAAM